MDEQFGTKKFTTLDKQNEIRAILESVYSALKQKGYDPINQLIGYIISEDPTYITGYGNARTLITKVDRDEMLRELMFYYLEGSKSEPGEEA
ncbi:MAG: IreB family regulatory phosphoprotein [Oscillospiraceae bacterium]|jgi:uncharacterized protein (UPF0297 family)|nr:IreB family regulatory phosphoprotein [Oscillospiraceae bacterium]